MSGVGAAAAFIVLPLDVYRRTGSPFWLTASFLVTVALRGLFSMVAGSIADRFERRRLMIVTDLLSVGCWTALTFIHSVTGLLSVAVIAQVLVTPHWLASDAAVPNLVGGDMLTRANATISIAGNISMLVGPAVGAALVALSQPSVVYGTNAASFLISALLIAMVPGRFGPDHRGRPQGSSSGRGRRWAWSSYILHDPVLIRLLCAWGILGVAFDMTLVADLPLVRVFHAGPIGYGIMQSAAGLGAIIGALAARVMSRRVELLVLTLAPAAVGAANGIVALAPVFWVVIVGTFVGSLAAAPQEVASDGMTQRRSPDEIRGRVFAAMSGAYYLGSACGITLSGLLLSAFGPRTVFAIGAVGVMSAVPILYPVRRSSGMVIAHLQP